VLTMVHVKLVALPRHVMEENVTKEMQVHANAMVANVGKKDVAQWHVMEETVALILLHLMDAFLLLVRERLFLLDLDQLQLLTQQK